MAVPCLGLCPFTSKGSGSIPGERQDPTSQTAWPKKKKKKMSLFSGHQPGLIYRWCSLQEESQTSVHTARMPTAHTPSSFQDNPISTKVFQRQNYPPPLPVYLLQAGPSAGHHGLKNIWVSSAKPHLCFPRAAETLNCYALPGCHFVSQVQEPCDFSASPFLV